MSPRLTAGASWQRGCATASYSAPWPPALASIFSRVTYQVAAGALANSALGVGAAVILMLFFPLRSP